MELTGRDVQCIFCFVSSSTAYHQERTAQSLTQRLLAARPAERARPIRHVPTQFWRCWVVCWWYCVSPPPGWVPLRWLSWPSSRSPVPFSSPGSVVIGTSSSSPSTTLDMLLSHERSRPPYKNSGKQPAKQTFVFKETFHPNLPVWCVIIASFELLKAKNYHNCFIYHWRDKEARTCSSQ